MRLRSPDMLRDTMRAAGTPGQPLSLRELGIRAGCSKAMIGHLLTGKYDRIRDTTAAAIERGLGVPAGHLFTVDDRPRRFADIERRKAEAS